MSRDFERSRFEQTLKNLREEYPEEGRTPISELSDDKIIEEVDYLIEKAWSVHYLK